MYKVEEVARELNVSRQAIYKKLNKDNIKTHIVLVDGVKHITEDGLNILKGVDIDAKEIIDEHVDDRIEVEEVSTDNSTMVESKIVDILNDVIVSKDKDINHLRKENEKLMQLMEQQNQLLLNSQKLQEKALTNTELLLLEKRQQLIERQTHAESKKKKRWFFNLFKVDK